MKYIIGVILFLMGQYGYSDTSISIGVGKGFMLHNGTPFERAIEIGYQYKLGEDVYVRPQLGYFLDTSGDSKSSYWGSLMFGVKARTVNGTEVHAGFGPAYLKTPDKILGGHFPQFNLEIGYGYVSEKTYLGIAWVHISSAGICKPNLGRDFFQVQWRILWI